MIRQTLAISQNTYTESIRQPIFSVLTLLAILCMMLNLMVSAYTMEDDNKLMIDIGMSILFFTGLLLSCFTAAGVISQEVENKTVLTVVSKPVSRPSFVVGKFLGVAGAIGTFVWIISIAFLMVARHKVMQTASDEFDMPVILFGVGGLIASLLIAALGNYLYSWVFTSTFIGLTAIIETFSLIIVLFIDREWSFQNPLTDLDIQLVMGLFMVFLALLVVTGLAVAVSTRLGQVMTLNWCLGFTVIGLISDNYLGLRASTSVVYDFFYRIVPNIRAFWPADYLTQAIPIPPSHVLNLGLYAFFLIAALLSIGVVLFQRREVG